MSPSNDVLQHSDTELAEKLRRDDPEQYLTLVRMHLSFVLDLNTEDYDNTTCEKTKTRPFKWNLSSAFSKNRKPNSKGVMEGAPLTQEGICQVYQLIQYLSKEENIKQEGVFRRTGKLTRQQELKNLLNQGTTISLNEGKYSVHDCASVLKNFLAELPEPLLTEAHYQAYCQIAEKCGIDSGEQSSRLLRALQLLCMLLPTENQSLLSDLLKLLHLAASHEGSNKMSADNLATLFTPHLLCPRKLLPEELHAHSQTMAKVVSFMIKQGSHIFSVPPKLATDIRAYWAEKEKHKEDKDKTSTEQDIAAVNTVFSFVDRQLTAQAFSSTSTEAAIADLYAYIQSLPESAHKRRLIKQFNKENGHGTPLHIQKAHTKSISDSIKKHIFSKSHKRHKSGTGTPAQQHNTSMENLLKAQSRVEKIDNTSSSKSSPKPLSSTSATPKQSIVTEQVLVNYETHLIVSDVPNFPATPNPVSDNPWHGLPLTTSTPALTVPDDPTTFCTPSRRGFNKSMSPITRSTHKMPRCMQESMMTPRSRKPVLVLSNSNLIPYDSLTGACVVPDLLKSPQKHLPECTAEHEDSLTSPFKDYLVSRSVLTASPVDLSMQLTPERLSESMMYCLDGNDPESSRTTEYYSSSGSRKRSGDDSLFQDHSISLSSDSAKKSTLESSFSSTVGSISHVRETSL